MMHSWFHPPDGSSLDAPYTDNEAWTAIGQAVEREFTKLRADATAAQAKSVVKSPPLTLVTPIVSSEKDTDQGKSKRRGDPEPAGMNSPKRSRKDDHAANASSAKKRTRPGPAARARKKVLNMTKKGFAVVEP
jgi:hypothetical protein